MITETTPRVPLAERVSIEPLGGSFQRVLLRFGFMEMPNVPKALGLARKEGLTFDIMSTSFFLSRRSVRMDPRSGMRPWQDRIFIRLEMLMMRAATSNFRPIVSWRSGRR